MLGYNNTELECMKAAINAALTVIDQEKYPAISRNLYNASEFISGLQVEGWTNVG